MSTEDRKAVVRDAFAAWDEGDAADFETVYAEDVAHPSHDLSGVDELQDLLDEWLTAFPDLSHIFDAMIGEGNWVATRFRITGTHQGSFQGIDPIGEEIEIHGMAMERIENGEIVERWLVEDLLDFYLQLGAVEPTAN
jgi:predicted ester cyclase